MRKVIIIILPIIATFGFIFFSEWISFEALKDNRAEISEFRDKNFTLSIGIFWVFYVILVVFSLPGAAVASVSGGFLFGLGAGLLINVTALMAPLLLASKADKILTSSLFVSDTNVSVFLMPASVKIS